ncbi:MAG: O-antigen ligase family protein [Oscillospiraceae bacterium]|nr:O-antigen ligase family protein [Oscillospiraceae bacterium]
MENKFAQATFKVYFMAVAVLMYYFLTEVINLGVFVTYRHAFALVLFASAFLAFLYKPNIARGASSIKATFVYCTPLIITVFVSLFIWFMEQVDTEIIARGLSGVFVYNNMLSFTLAAVAFLYVFGEKGIWYNLVAILISNILMLLTIILQNGIGSFFSEFISLVVTFAAETGDIIVQAEIHELAFCLGAYLIYMFLKPKKDIVFFILLGLTSFCFLTAFKRIGIIAIVIALVFGWFLKLVAKFKKDTAMRLTVIFSVILAVLLIGYVAIIKLDVFSLLEKAGIDTSGRVTIYNAVDKFYEFSPEFLGNGIGFLTYQLSTNMNVGVSSVHNDFLQYFIDLGFWGYILWLTSMTLVRVCYFGKKGKVENGIIALALSLYLVIVSSTDNTMNYPLLTTVLAIIMIGHGFDEKVRTCEMKMFGHISDANKETEVGTIL